MSVRAQTLSEVAPPSPTASRRPAWRRRLVDLERGLMLGFRASGAVAVHFFCGMIGLIAGLLLGLSAVDWAVLIVCFATSLAFELGHHAVTLLCRSLPPGPNGSRQAECISAAAATLAMCGGIAASLVILGSQAMALWRD
jgi:hypothetical protein